ncbi:Serine carboxypeptidase-like 50 [Ancistrocladus abbreviatus]
MTRLLNLIMAIEPRAYTAFLLHLSLSLLLISFPSSSSTKTYSFPEEALPSKSGYLPVNPTTGSSIYYAFYEAQEPISHLNQTPLVIWLQGGPGCSSMLGNFYELGPWRVHPSNESIELERNKGAWNRIFGLVFLDNPIGTGFSIAASPKEIPRDQYGVASHLYIAIRSFIALDPSFESRPIYITGESYAGKYVPAIGYYILMANAKLPDSKKIKLAGVAIGNGLTDPKTQVMTHAVNAYFTGLINDKQKTQLELAQLAAVKLVDAKIWCEATNARNRVLEMLQEMTGLATLYDLRRKIPYQTQLVEEFLSAEEVKQALGVNASMVWEECSDVVAAALHDDVMKSVRFMVEVLLRQTKVLLYQGQSDLRDGVVSVQAWIKKLKWEGIWGFQASDRKVWKVNGELAGYVQKWWSLSHVVVLGAGHFVPTDQAVNSQAMIEDWIQEKGLFTKGKDVKSPPSIPKSSL